MSLHDDMTPDHTHHHHDVGGDEPFGVDRRTFLKLAGFSFAGAVVAGCQEGQVGKAIPFLVQPEEVTPGMAYWYATTCGGCRGSCGVLAKNRDGRPVKLEGNPDHPLSRGGLCAVGQASLLSLYDSRRLHYPLKVGRESSWEAIDTEIVAALSQIQASGGAVRVLSGTLNGPTTRATIRQFLSRFKDARHIQYEGVSQSAVLASHAMTHGRRAMPRFLFDRAEVIVSIDADFLGNWISPVEYTAAYRRGRTLESTPPRFSHHTQIESRLTLSGSNADERIAVAPSELETCLATLASLIGEKTSSFIPAGSSLSGDLMTQMRALADRLWSAREKSLIVCGLNSLPAQLLTNTLNQLLGNYGSTLDIDHPSNQVSEDDGELQMLVEEIHSGKIKALFLAGGNPVYDLPDGSSLAESIRKIPLVVSLGEREDETASVAKYVCPQPHALEGWNDVEAVAGLASIVQPLIQPLFKTRSLLESFTVWMGRSQTAYDCIREEWRKTVFTRQSLESSFETFWGKTLHDGYARLETPKRASTRFVFPDAALMTQKATHTTSVQLCLYASSTMLDGRHAHNPWLHELPDPVTKIVWDNYASVSRSTANSLKLAEGDIVRIDTEGKSIELPVHIQPGQHDAVVAVALGYGRKGTERFTDIGPKWIQARPTVEPGGLVGRNASHLIKNIQGLLTYTGLPVVLTRTGASHTLAATQEYDSLRDPNLLGRSVSERRPIVQETTFAAYLKDPAAGQFPKHHIDTMWPEDHLYTGYHWGMVVDLTACTGCSACVIGCQAENNIPVVGKDEVYRNRELTWIRLDRYYDEEDGSFSVSHQPMMCQHCGNAPCETVCPVLATVHSDEGLNQQVYNRCVGTRYCANNCPYKIRRFNWFQYPRGDDTQKMVLNPDVTIRDRGVMEKCSFCIQRIQRARIEAKEEGRKIRDGDIQPACAQSCPAQAIVFGDMNDPESEVSKRMKNPRHYKVLEEIGVRPSVGYMTLVRNRPVTSKEEHHG